MLRRAFKSAQSVLVGGVMATCENLILFAHDAARHHQKRFQEEGRPSADGFASASSMWTLASKLLNLKMVSRQGDGERDPLVTHPNVCWRSSGPKKFVQIFQMAEVFFRFPVTILFFHRVLSRFTARYFDPCGSGATPRRR